MRRCLLLLLVAVPACQFGLAQAQLPVGMSLLASEGNVYGVNYSSYPTLQFFSYSPITFQTDIIANGVNFSQLCLARRRSLQHR
jgi:hypothetical protein